MSHKTRARVKNVVATTLQADHIPKTEGGLKIIHFDTSNGHIISVQTGGSILYIQFQWGKCVWK